MLENISTMRLFWMLAAATALLLAACPSGGSATPLLDLGRLLNFSAPSAQQQASNDTAASPLLSLFQHHVDKRSSHHDEDDRSSIDGLMLGNDNAQQLVQMAAMLPIGTLQLVRQLAVPLLNTTLALPADVLQGILVLKQQQQHNGTAMFNASEWLNTTTLYHESPLTLLSHHKTSSLFGNSTLLGFDSLSDNSSTSSSMSSRLSSMAYHLGNGTSHAFDAARNSSAAHLGERLLVTPLAALLSSLTSSSASGFSHQHHHQDGNRHAASLMLPTALDGDHLQRHIENLTRFLGAATHLHGGAADNSTSEQPPATQPASDDGQRTTTTTTTASPATTA